MMAQNDDSIWNYGAGGFSGGLGSWCIGASVHRPIEPILQTGLTTRGVLIQLDLMRWDSEKGLSG